MVILLTTVEKVRKIIPILKKELVERMKKTFKKLSGL